MESWLITKAQDLLKSAKELEDPTAKSLLIDTAAELMQRAIPKEENEDEDDE